MINNTELTAVPEYAASSAYVEEPTPAQIDQGTLPGEKLPSEWWNFYTQLQTLTNNNTKAAFDNILSELKGVLALGGLSADGTTTQLATLFGRFVFGSGPEATNQVTDIDAITKSGFYWANNTATGGPSLSYWRIIHIAYRNTSSASQIAFDGSTSNTWFRHKNGGVWTAWRKMWNDGNDGSGSGLDADTVDGVESARIVFGDNNYGATSWEASANDITKSGFYRLSNTAGSDGPTIGEVYHIIHTQNPNSGYFAFQIAVRSDSTHASYIREKSTTWSPWVKLWNAGNDGSGSGLDADTLDGIDSSYFPFGSNSFAVSAPSDLNAITKFGAYSHSSTTTNGPGFYGVTVHLPYDANNAVQFAYGYSGANNKIRRKISGTWGSWFYMSTGDFTAIPVVTSDPASPVVGQMWLRSDL